MTGLFELLLGHRPAEWAQGTLRISTGRMTSEAEIKRAVDIIVKSVKRLYASG